jgi:diguanylate cyclase (GGDEF)-like protein/PAS domain S-box-containing protein
MSVLLISIFLMAALVGIMLVRQQRARSEALATANAKLHADEGLYRTLFAFTTDGVICHAADGTVISANPAAQAILGQSEAQMRALGPWQVWREMSDGEGNLLHTENYPCAIASQSGQHVKDTVVGMRHWKSDQMVWVQLESIPLRRTENSTVGQVIAVFMDVTEHRRSENRFRVIVDSSPNALLMIDHDGTIALANSASQRIFGYTEQELLGSNVDMLVPEQAQTLHSQQRRQYLVEPDMRPVGSLAELSARHKDGRTIAVDIGLSPISTVDGNFTLVTVVDVTARRNAEQAVARMAYFDELTGLGNRRLLIERLQHALVVSARHQRFGALLCLDVDNFKSINDSMGHDAGDLMLQEVARRLKSALRESDSVARVGGDEFVVLLEELNGRRGGAASYAREVADKVLRLLSQPYAIRDREFAGSVSIGVALWGGDARDDVNDLLKKSDMAMFDAKRSGRNTVRFFDPKMQRALEGRIQTETDLRRALDEQQFLLYYQKRVGTDGALQGAEALVRWKHPVLGLVPPLDFIPIAEETGLIVPIGRWVLETACQQLKRWEATAETRDLNLSVNISAVEFRQEHLVRDIERILARTGANPARLELEITESTLFENVELFIAKINALRALGLAFALDDFGTGYSSLSYLKSLPLNVLKIDRSFVSDIDRNQSDEAIVQTIIRIGQTLGLGVVAEGVETQAQWAVLQRHGCQVFQGYLFGRPVPIAVFEQEFQTRV